MIVDLLFLVLPVLLSGCILSTTGDLSTVAGLENTGHWQAAAIGYATALKRWDESFVAWMGLGNSKYNLHQLDASAEAFYQATLL